ncbi:MAG: hypothetical protein JXB45_07350 [Candidatus Krumholzibacteriota bacterium]|nr:hypothetical protein [Candidatus Krumholzibacteriota bacterium]
MSFPRIIALLLILVFGPVKLEASAGTGGEPVSGKETSGGNKFTLLSRSLLQGPSRKAVFFGPNLILASGGGIAVASPADSLRSCRFLPLEGQPYDLIVREQIAYIASWETGLIVVDLSSPENPSVLGGHRIHRALNCCLCASRLIISNKQSKLYIFSLEDPALPALLGTKSISAPTMSLSGENGILAAVSTQEIQLLRGEEKGGFTSLHRLKTASRLKKGLLSGGILYAVTTEGEILRWDLSDPSHPTPLPDFPLRKAVDFDLSAGSGLVLSSQGKIIPFRVDGMAVSVQEAVTAAYRDREEMPAISGDWIQRITRKTSSDKYAGSRVTFSGRKFVTLDPRSGPWVYDREGNEARFLANISTRGTAIDLVAEGEYLYLANCFDGLRIGRVNDGGTVSWIGHLPTAEARDVAVADGIVYLADGQKGLKTVDVGDPRHPRLIGSLSSPYYYSAIVVKAGRAYVAGGMGGAEIVDISDPRSPRSLWRQDLSEVRGVQVDDRYAYFADGGEGYRVYSIEGERPVPSAHRPTRGWNCDLFIRGDILYLTEGGKGITLDDMADRTNPRELAHLDMENTVGREIHAFGSTLFVASHIRGITAVDVSRPRDPYIAARYNTVDDGRGVFADSRFVYLASGAGGVYIFKYHE